MSQSNDAFASLFETNYERQKPKRRGRGWAIAAWIVGILAILLAIVYFLTDSGLRGAAETVAAQQVQAKLPDGAAGNVKVTIGGGSVVAQYLSGSFDDVRVSIPKLTAGGATSALDLRASGVSTDLGKPVQRLDGTVTFGPESLVAVIPSPGVSQPKLGDGTVTFTGTQMVAGHSITYSVTAMPSVTGASVVFTSKSAAVTAGATAAEQPAVVRQLMAQKPAVCLAKYVPKDTKLTGVRATPSGLSLTFAGTQVTLSGQTFRPDGTCA